MLWMLGGLVLAAVGTYMVCAYALTRTYVRAPGVIVDLVDPKRNTTTKTMAAVFEFIDSQGRVVRKTSSKSQYPWPKVGTQVMVLYDPADPERTADTLGTANWTLAAGVFFLIGGLGVFAMGLFEDTLKSL